MEDSKPILKSVISAQKKNILSELDFLVLVSNLLSGLKEKQQKIIVKRFGLDGSDEATLASIGNLFNITRERVRQIEQSSIDKIRDLKKEHYSVAIEFIISILQDYGGIISEEKLMEILLENIDEKQKALNRQVIKFLLALDESVVEIKESGHLRKGYGLKHYPIELTENVVMVLTSILEAKGEVLIADALLTEMLEHELYKNNQHKISRRFLESCFDLSKHILKSEKGLGLTSWPNINPRTVRDKAYYVLNKNSKPMHFEEIAKAIETTHFDNKKATVQTVHNELIADLRFVLIGRGIYGLSEWGYEKGTVAEVIEKIMKQTGRPMSKDEIIKKVLEKRQVQKSTILVNLQTQSRFKKTGEGFALASQ